jgi:hypothetical protein
MTGHAIDLEDLYNYEEPDPAKTYLSVLPYWEYDVNRLDKSLKCERGGFTLSIEGSVIYSDGPLSAVRNYQQGRDISRKGWGHKKIRKKQRMRPSGWHGHHPEQKPIKRWSRQTLESIVMLDGTVATYQDWTDGLSGLAKNSS